MSRSSVDRGWTDLHDRRLPRTLGAATDAFADSELARTVFGAEFHDSYTKYKRSEWDEFCLVVGEWEKERYLHMI